MRLKIAELKEKVARLDMENQELKKYVFSAKRIINDDKLLSFYCLPVE